MDEEEESEAATSKPTPKNSSDPRSETASPAPSSETTAPKRKFAANASLGIVPKPLTKRTLLAESAARETLRKEFMQLQERVKASPLAIPFVFYDGSNIPGGVCRVTKGDFVWKFLDASRKVGAEVGAGVDGEKGKSDARARREWAKVGVDDLMMVRGEIIIPPVSPLHHVLIG
jgi:protein FAM50